MATIAVAEIKARLGRSYDAQREVYPLLHKSVSREQYIKANTRAAMRNLRDFGESLECFKSCERCNGTGVIDAPYSGSDPACPDCN